MKTILQSAQIPFNSISIQDAITMVPMMDRLANEFVELSKAAKDGDEAGIRDYVLLGKQLFILEQLGFCTSVEGMIQYDPKLFPEIRDILDVKNNS